jgi:uncharacterized SAM-binding protein YcdF (DUF218 family)
MIAIRILRAIVLSAGALLLVVTFTPLVPWAARPLAHHWTDVDHGVLIVLSGSTIAYSGSPPQPLIGVDTYWRTIHAIHVWRSGHFQTILLSGADMAETVKPLLILNGIPESAILVENRAMSTHENALFSKPVLASLPGPYVLLTSDYHMFRAARCFAHEGIRVETLPAPDLFKRAGDRIERWPLFFELLREYVSIAYYRFHGWI